jgi:hypothetical protein
LCPLRPGGLSFFIYLPENTETTEEIQGHIVMICLF